MSCIQPQIFFTRDGPVTGEKSRPCRIKKKTQMHEITVMHKKTGTGIQKLEFGNSSGVDFFKGCK